MARNKRQTAIATALALAGVVALVVSLSFVGAAAWSGGGADAGLATISSDRVGYVSAAPAKQDNTTSTTGSHGGAVSFGQGTATAVSCLRNGSLVSRATADIPSIDLFDGRVTADAIHLSAVATADADVAVAETTGSTITNLRVDGVSVEAGTITVSGLGTLRVLATDVAPPGARTSAEVVGLYLELTTDADGLAAGTVVMVGHATAQADTATYARLADVPTPTPTRTASPRPSPTSTASHKPTPTPTPAWSTGAVPPTGTGGTSTYSMPAAGTPDAALLARFPGAVFPVVGSYTYVDTWHAPRAGGRLHEGTDVFAAYGTPIVAAQNGVIGSVSTYGTGGNALHLNNDQGDYFYYAHLSSFAPGLAQGQRVQAGQTVGYVGTTGDAQGTSPHLHFEIHPLGGAAINPYSYLNAWRGAGSSVDVATAGSTGTADGADSAPITPGVKKQGGAGAADADLAAAMDRVATGLAALDGALAGDERPAPRKTGTGEAVLTVLSAAGALAVKKLKLAALLP